MTLISSNDSRVLLDRLSRLRVSVTHHKAEIRRQREALQQTMSTLAALEAECLRRGLIHVGEATESSHGHR